MRRIWRRQNGRGAKHHQGFTLVELAIVLVIVGLLIGGILVAQSMIKTAKIQRFVRQVGQFDAAVVNFETKYSRLPGDNQLFGNVGVTEDGNIEDASGGTTLFDGEIARFWNDLSLSGLKNPSGSDYAVGAGSIDIGTEIPKSDLSDKAGFVAWGASGANYYTISKVSGAALSAGGFIPADALAVDLKIDNGTYNTGNVTMSENLSGMDITYLAPSGCRSAAMGTPLLVTGTTEACSVKIRIGTSTGDLK